MTETKPNLVVAVAGVPKTGKTHFSLTFPDPIKIFSFDLGCKPVVAKFPDKAIDVVEYPLPIVDSLQTKDAGFSKLWKQVQKDIYEAIGVYQTIVIDTATALWEIIRYGFNEENDRAVGEGGRARSYGEPNARMYGIVMRAQVGGTNLVLTQYLKDRYVNDQNTGEKDIDGWRRTAGLADVVVLTDRTTSGKKTVMKMTIADCRFDRDLCGYSQEDMTYDDLSALLGF